MPAEIKRTAFDRPQFPGQRLGLAVRGRFGRGERIESA